METLDILKDLALELVTACSDVDLLDLICKILASDLVQLVEV